MYQQADALAIKEQCPPAWLCHRAGTLASPGPAFDLGSELYPQLLVSSACRLQILQLSAFTIVVDQFLTQSPCMSLCVSVCRALPPEAAEGLGFFNCKYSNFRKAKGSLTSASFARGIYVCECVCVFSSCVSRELGPT